MDASTAETEHPVGRWIRHYRTSRGMTLEDLAARITKAPSHVSQIETGKRQPSLALLTDIAAALDVTVAALVQSGAPDRRTELEMALARAQDSDAYQSLGLPKVRMGKSLSTEALEVLVGLHSELANRSIAAAATPEEARKANAALRQEMREQMNYFPDIEKEAAKILSGVSHSGGPIGELRISQIAEYLGFTLHHVQDLPHSTRSVTDLHSRRIYLPQSGWGGHDPRTIVLQTLGHQVLQHRTPHNFADFLRQRVEVNYFAAAVLVPEAQAVDLLVGAKQGKYLAVEDLRDAFAVSYETAAHRFTNLATQHLGLRLHFLKLHESGTIYKAYENNGLPLPMDATGAIEGQVACRHWPARYAVEHVEPGTTHWQYVDTPSGTYWCAVQTEQTSAGKFAISVGVTYAESKWFRGRETTLRTKSTCPDENCCRRPPRELAARWNGYAWPSARAHSHLLAALPPGTFPGVDTTEVYSFLEQHSS